jgi:hypothetical protein
LVPVHVPRRRQRGSYDWSPLLILTGAHSIGARLRRNGVGLHVLIDQRVSATRDADVHINSRAAEQVGVRIKAVARLDITNGQPHRCLRLAQM